MRKPIMMGITSHSRLLQATPTDKCYNAVCSTAKKCSDVKDGNTECCEEVRQEVSVGLNEQTKYERNTVQSKAHHRGSGTGTCKAQGCSPWRGATKCVDGQCLCTGPFVSVNGFCTRLPPHGPTLIDSADHDVQVIRDKKNLKVKMKDLKVGDQLKGKEIMSGKLATVVKPPSAYTTWECEDTAKLNPPPMFIDGAMAGRPGTLLIRAGGFLRGKGYQRFNAVYQLIDLSDPTHGLKILDKALKDNYAFSANPWHGAAMAMKPPKKSLPTRPVVWKVQEKGPDWEKLIRPQSNKEMALGTSKSTRGNCICTNRLLTCGHAKECKSDPKNPCKGKCVCDKTGVNECICTVPGFVGESGLWKQMYNLKD